MARDAAFTVQALGLEGATSIPAGSRVGFGVHDLDTPAFEGHWPAVGRTWGRVDAVDGHRLVQLFFSYDTFIGLALEDEAVSLDDDPLKPLGEAFRRAAVALDAEVGWIDAMAHYGDEDWENRVGSNSVNTTLARRSLERGVEALVEEHLSLIWIRQDVATSWDGPLFDREFEATPEGWLLWAGDASGRWT